MDQTCSLCSPQDEKEASDELDDQTKQRIDLELKRVVTKRRKLDVQSKSLDKIHGISLDLLEGAPSVEQVKRYINRIVGEFERRSGQKVVLVGHSIVNDIESLDLDTAQYIDTTNIRFKSDQQGEIKKLKVLVKENLGFEIQSGTHSSI
jgi:hypothetical protein